MSEIADNTDVNKLRRRLVEINQSFEESMTREIARLKESNADLDAEIKEGMSNRVGSGFYANEANDYAEYLVKRVLNKTIEDLESIQRDLLSDITGLVGDGYVHDVAAIGGLIGNASTKNYEQSELTIKVLTPPE
jgi:chorismate mutase